MPRPDETVTVLRPSTLPSDVRAHVLTIVAGPDAGRTIQLAGPLRTLVGQSRACEVILSDSLVSRRHVALEPALEGLRVVDLGSRNGTFVNGVRVEQGIAGAGDRITLGDTTLVIAAADAPAAPIETRASFGRLVGASPEMRALYPLLDRLAASDIPALIEGETGTGKEVLAEALHEAGPRRSGPFVVFDCTAVPPNLAESELFGHERGAFTGALATRRGVFEQADGGTLFIDEIGDLDPALQPKLLRLLERSAVRRLGGDTWIRANVRVLCATRRDLDREVSDGRFRDDLFYRLVVGRVELPPLRKRRGDVAVLAQAFWASLGRTGPIPFELVRRLDRHEFPGNVRELKNTVARHVALGDTDLTSPGAPPPSAAADEIDSILARNLPFPGGASARQGRLRAPLSRARPRRPRRERRPRRRGLRDRAPLLQRDPRPPAQGRVTSIRAP